MVTVLITGGAGFIASHLIEHIIRCTKWNIVCIDKLSYASKGFNRLKDSGVFYNPRLTTLTWDLEHPFTEGLITELGNINIIIHMAADTHVDYSIANPVEVIRNNVMSTVYLLEYGRKLSNLHMFQYFSTDEVFGPAYGDMDFKETDPHCPTNPYSASKAAAEDICLAYQNTYQLPLIITNLMNVYGERQYAFNFIPHLIKNILDNKTIDIHTEEDGTIGSRFYIHARNVASAVLFILEHGKSGEKYNIRGEKRVTNLELAQLVANIIGKELKYNLINNPPNRPFHDAHYSICGDKLTNLGWQIPVDFEKSLTKSVKWTLEHQEWLEL
jgi:dTDP-glucose 4,6-dehydratase